MVGFKLNTNTSELSQPDNTYRFGLNVVTDPEHKTSTTNEPSNSLCVDLPAETVGSITIDRNRELYFCADNSINLVDTDACTITELVKLDEFEFDINSPITGTHRIVRGCESVVYFFDHKNKDRYINIDRLSKHKTLGEFDVTKFDFNPEVTHSTISTEILSSGGKLEYGTYNFAVEFLNQNEDTVFVTPVDINYTPITYKNNEGALNISTNLPEIGGKPVSSQSIKIKVINIPEDAILCRIIVFRHITSDGFTSDAHAVGQLIPVNGEELIYTYRGFSPQNGDYLVDKNEYLSKRISYESSLNGIQVQNRLLRYNLKESVKDYSGYQAFASKICCKYVTKKVSKSTKNIYLFNQTLNGGEIILPCINFVHADGTESPSFPLVNRSKLPTDEVMIPNIFENNSLTITTSYSQSGNNQTLGFNYTFDTFVPNIQLKIKYGNQNPQTFNLNNQQGSVSATFPNGIFIPSVYIITPEGETFLGFFEQNITFEHLISTTEIEKWKVYSTAIRDGAPVQGFQQSGRFGYYEISQQYTNPPNYCGDNYWGVDCENNVLLNEKVRLFVVPDRSQEPQEDINNIYPIGIYFDESTIDYPDDTVVGHYFSIAITDSNILSKGIGVNTFLSSDEDNPNTFSFHPLYNPSGDSNTNIDRPTYNFISNENLIKQEYINADYALHEGSWIINYKEENQTYTNLFDTGLPYDTIKMYYFKTTNNDYTLIGPEAQRIIDNYIIPPRTTFENITNYSLANPINYLNLNANFNNGYRFKYLTLKTNIQPITNIWAIVTRRLTELNNNVSFNGEYFISPLQIDNLADMDVLKQGVLDTLFFGSTNVSAYIETLTGFHIESKTNSYLRHDGASNCNKTIQNTENVFNFFLNKIIEPYNDSYKIRSSICPFFPGYNADYSYIQDLNRYFTIGFTYDFCSDCTGLYPNRMIFSSQSFQEDLSDGFRISKANDYIDLPSEHGGIIAVDYVDNRLFVRTEKACYILIPNAQQLELSETTAYIGTGDFLSIPAQELKPTKIGFGGQQHKLDSINFEHGLVWADKERGEIYHIAGDFNIISSDMEKWFGDNLQGDLRFTYDPYHNRVILTNKDKWTLSYCFEIRGWRSWHSYIPEHYNYNGSTFFSVYNNALYKHNSNNFTVFYDYEWPSIVEFIVKDFQTFKGQSIYWHSNTYLIDTYQKDVKDITFDQMLCYNDVQSTGLQELRLNDENSIYYSNTITDVKETDRNYKASPLKDLAIDNNIWTVDISSIKQDNQGYMDKLPVVDVDKPQVEQGDFRSKWLGVRLYFNNHEHKITFEFGDTLKLYSIR